MSELVLPQDPVPVAEEEPRHHPWVANGQAHQVALAERTNSGLHGGQTEQLADLASSQAESRVQVQVRIGEGYDLGPARGEEVLPLLDRALMNENHPG